VGGEGDGDRSKSRRVGEEAVFDTVREHRWYCPWVWSLEGPKGWEYVVSVCRGVGGLYVLGWAGVEALNGLLQERGSSCCLGGLSPHDTTMICGL
jgi:hypothetical protein